jgi:predicted DNA-binding protein (MmcQ/YjbR family)
MKCEEAGQVLRDYAMSFPEAWEDFPWGDHVVKVGKKIFVFIGEPDRNEGGLGLGVKLPQSAMEALEEPWATPTGYGLGKAGWVSLRFAAGSEPPVDRLKAWIDESYRAIAPKKLIKKLGAPPGA